MRQPWLTQGYGTVIVGGQSSVTVKERGGLRRRPHQSDGRGPAADDVGTAVPAGGGTGFSLGHVVRTAASGLVATRHIAGLGRKRSRSAVVTACIGAAGPLMAIADNVGDSPAVGQFCAHGMDGLAGIVAVP